MKSLAQLKDKEESIEKELDDLENCRRDLSDCAYAYERKKILAKRRYNNKKMEDLWN